MELGVGGGNRRLWGEMIWFLLPETTTRKVAIDGVVLRHCVVSVRATSRQYRYLLVSTILSWPPLPEFPVEVEKVTFSEDRIDSKRMEGVGKLFPNS